jgi:hypothetical protein
MTNKTMDSRTYEAMRKENPTLPEWNEYLLKSIAQVASETQNDTQKILNTNKK